MAEVIWTTVATKELEDIGFYLEAYSEYYAKAIVKKIYSKVGTLTKFTMLGRVIPEVNDPKFREIIEGNYRVMYELLDEDVILIQRVIHSSRFFE